MTGDSRDGVAVLCPGGLEYSGGIGRAMAYLLAQWASEESARTTIAIDTRGGGRLILAPWFFLVALLRLAWLRLSGRISLVHINIASRGSAARKCVVVLLCAALRLRFVMHLHGAQFDQFYASLPNPGKFVVRWMFRRAARVIVLGDVWRRFVVDKLRVPFDRIDVICNGVPAPAASSPPHRGPVHIVFLGRLGDRKGVPELLAALSSDRLSGLEWRATLAGDGEIERFRAEASRRGLTARIEFPGWVGQTEAASILASGDIFVLPSYNEGLPVAVLEALAHGIATVATPVGSLAEFLTDRDQVLFVPPGDVDALTGALERLVVSADTRRVLGANGRLVFRRHFDIAATARAVRQSHDAAWEPRMKVAGYGGFVAPPASNEG